MPRKEASYRSVHDSHNSESYRDLPGKNIRAEGESAVKDKDVNQAFDNVGHVLDFYKEYFKWDSIDGQNADIISSVHFGRHFQNACQYLCQCSLHLHALIEPSLDKRSKTGFKADGLWRWC